MVLRTLAQNKIELVAVKIGLLCNENGVAHGVGQGIAGHRLKKCTARAGLCCAATAACPIAFQIAAHHDRQDAIFFTQDALDFPALFIRISRNSLTQDARVQIGLVAVIRVFDKQLIHPKGQDIDKAIAIMLVDCRVHDDGLCKIMWL